MLGMGVTLRIEDFQNILKFPHWVFIGVLLQFTVMPFLGWGLGHLFRLPTPFHVGLILVSCCSGGTASNVSACQMVLFPVTAGVLYWVISWRKFSPVR
jgi:bile acid:Na+ symporter, BASS family